MVSFEYFGFLVLTALDVIVIVASPVMAWHIIRIVSDDMEHDTRRTLFVKTLGLMS